VPKHRHNSDATRRELIQSASRRFAETGYAAARTEQIVADAGLTRGAMYHHFGDKLGLFRAVLEDVQLQLTAEVNRRAAAAAGGTLERLRAGFQAYLDVALRHDVRQILLVDGPAVLGWDDWHEIDLRYAFGATRGAIERAMNAGEIDAAPIDQLTHVLLGAVTQAGLELGRSAHPRAARRQYGQVVDLLIDKLRVNEGGR
jgi:AcrR family transcriptional regulator